MLAKTMTDVHILPLAREVDRAVLPFLPQNGADGPRPPILHAHRITLLVPPSPAAEAVADRVAHSLEGVAEVERLALARDPERPTAGVEGILEQVSRLLVRELGAGARVHINLSSGSKLVAFAAGLAGMAHLRPGCGSMYYVQPAGFSLSEEEFAAHGPTQGMAEVEELELVPLLLPSPLQTRVLAYLRGSSPAGTGYRELIEFLCRIPGSGYTNFGPEETRNWGNATTTRMVRSIVAPLVAEGLVTTAEHGRHRFVQLTPRGRLYGAMSGLAPEDLVAPVGLPSNPMPVGLSSLAVALPAS
ncbi:MAG: HFX_2341 family transcriptional regulator domain-containing protein [Thermoplasmatota archaeon]